MDRETAWRLLCEYTASDGLRKHGLAVEAVMRHFARKHGENEERWAVVGLIHDFDYERFPEQHPASGEPILREHGLPEDDIQAVLAHGDHMGIPREALLAKTLFAVDELAGFITAVALVRPNRSLAEVEAKSVRKKMKDKAFARTVNRDDITKGAAELGVDLDAHIGEVIEAMRPVAPQLGLG
jgi:predicted hydrolase (HD superfamily)